MTERMTERGKGHATRYDRAFHKPLSASDFWTWAGDVNAARSFEHWIRPIEAECKGRLEQAGHRSNRPPSFGSQTDYAERVLAQLDDLRAHLAHGSVDHALRCAAEIGILVREADMRDEVANQMREARAQGPTALRRRERDKAIRALAAELAARHSDPPGSASNLRQLCKVADQRGLELGDLSDDQLARIVKKPPHV